MRNFLFRLVLFIGILLWVVGQGWIGHALNIVDLNVWPMYMLIFPAAGLLYVALNWCVQQVSLWWTNQEENIAGLPVQNVLFRYLGLVAGLLVGLMMYPALTLLEPKSGLVPMMIDLLLALIGYRIGSMKENELQMALFRRSLDPKKTKNTSTTGDDSSRSEQAVKLLDTSAIIDGRIADLAKSGFLDGPIIVPDFVIQELQQIADSSDMLKRNRGRRGLDILQQIQRETPNVLQIRELRLEQGDVDTRLVKLAKRWQAKVMTNDYNLNKVCELHGVAVLNLNELANALKPMVLPGELLRVQIIRDGKEPGQGVGYLEDGTMVVVDGGKEVIGQMTEVVVSSVLQTSAGKMVFSKRKTLEPVNDVLWADLAVQ